MPIMHCEHYVLSVCMCCVDIFVEIFSIICVLEVCHVFGRPRFYGVGGGWSIEVLPKIEKQCLRWWPLS